MLRLGIGLLTIFSLILTGMAAPCSMTGPGMNSTHCACGPESCCLKNSNDAGQPLEIAQIPQATSQRMICARQSHVFPCPPVTTKAAFRVESILSKASSPDFQARLGIFLI